MYWFSILTVIGAVVLALVGMVSVLCVGALAFYWLAYGVQMWMARIKARRVSRARFDAVEGWVP